MVLWAIASFQYTKEEACFRLNKKKSSLVSKRLFLMNCARHNHVPTKSLEHKMSNTYWQKKYQNDDNWNWVSTFEKHITNQVGGKWGVWHSSLESICSVNTLFEMRSPNVVLSPNWCILCRKKCRITNTFIFHLFFWIKNLDQDVILHGSSNGPKSSSFVYSRGSSFYERKWAYMETCRSGLLSVYLVWEKSKACG